MKQMHNKRRRGSVLVYATFATFALASFAALAVDWGRVQVVKTELQAAADAASRYGAAGLQNKMFGVSAAKSNASAIVAQNKADGKVIMFDADQDVEIGIWAADTKTFTTTTFVNQANAVRVTLKCAQARGSAVPMMFLSMLGKSHTDVSAVSIAAIDFAGSTGGAGNGTYEYYIPATSNPWLAGAAAGTIANANNPHNNPDYAGDPFTDDGAAKDAVNYGSGQGSSTSANSNTSNWASWGNYASKKSSPITAGGVAISGGSTLTFDGINGGANNSSSNTFFDADGNTGSITTNRDGNENGIGDIRAPFNSIIAVFLNDNVPNPADNYPARLDFNSTSKRDFASLSPQLRQPFFIGDGRTSSGEVQQFVVPAGATRMFIGTMDSYEWSNNVGGFNLTTHTVGKIVTVK